MAKLTAADLLQPKGDVTPDWFPTLDEAGVTTLLDAYLDDGYGRVPDVIVDEAAQNAAARAWAMGRASRNVFMRLVNTPATFRLDNEGSQSILAEQVKAARLQAEKYEAEFETLTDVEATDSTVEAGGSGSAENSYRW